MWRERINTLAEDTDRIYEFAPPATYFQLGRIEQIFGVTLPDALKSLLLESNGVREILYYKDERVPIGQIFWDVETIQRNNRKMRKDLAYRDFYLPFDDLLFFASVSNDGVHLALQIAGDTASETVIAWSPTDDSRTEQATSLDDFITAWLSGKLELK